MPREAPAYLIPSDINGHRHVLERRAVLLRELALHQMEGGNLNTAAGSEERTVLLDHAAFWLDDRPECDSNGVGRGRCILVAMRPPA